MKFLILLFYYERPDLLINALASVKESTYPNWEMCVIDDGTKFPGIDQINEVFSFQERIDHRISYMQTFDSNDRKNQRGGSQFGEYANSAIKTSDADVILMLCDDDMLMPNYLGQLNEFYSQNQSLKYSYSHLSFYDPTKGLPGPENIVSNEYTAYLNSHTGPISPTNEVDSSQVSWRRRHWIEDGIKFPSPRTKNLDEAIYEHMYAAWGPCTFNKIVAQWKGIHKGQLINLSTNQG